MLNRKIFCKAGPRVSACALFASSDVHVYTLALNCVLNAHTEAINIGHIFVRESCC